MYANDPERLQMETARLYKEANFNPLAGCLPTFATLPVFIGLYRALSNAATEVGLYKLNCCGLHISGHDSRGLYIRGIYSSGHDEQRTRSY
jgi:hypothetical protein